MNTKELNALEAIEKELKSLGGHLGFYYKNLKSGFEYGVNADDIFLAASVIKLPLFLNVLLECEKGNISLDEKIRVENWEKVPSCGAINLFTDFVEADVLTLCKLMICLSDNTATNSLIRRFTIEGVEKGFLEMGLSKTKIRRLLFDSEASSRGIENTICPKELGKLLEKIYNGEFISSEKSKMVMDVLLKQQINHKMGGKLKGVKIAHKTGEDSMLSNDVGIVFGNDDFILCFAGHDTDVYSWEDLMRRGTFDIYKALN